MRRLLSTFWFRSVFPRLSPAWRDRVLDLLVEHVSIPNHAIRTGRRTVHLNELTQEQRRQMVAGANLPDAIRADVQLMVMVATFWGEEALKRFVLVPVPDQPQPTSLASLLQPFRHFVAAIGNIASQGDSPCNTTPRLRAFGVAALAAALVSTSFATAQSAGRQASAASGSDPVLTEIRELRAELRQATTASLRAQLLAARLQLADQRLSVILVNLTDARRGLAEQQSALDRASGDLQEAEKLLSPSPQALRDDLLTRVNALQRRINAIQSEQQRLQGQESELIRQLTAEQGRASGLNEGLDEVERALTKASQNR